MRFYTRDGEIEVVVSRRNLLAGLHKLDLPGSARELQSGDGIGAADGLLLRLRFEDDEEHYGHADRLAPPHPGPMLPATEAFIRAELRMVERNSANLNP